MNDEGRKDESSIILDKLLFFPPSSFILHPCSYVWHYGMGQFRYAAAAA
jgi:hypothetical protein